MRIPPRTVTFADNPSFINRGLARNRSLPQQISAVTQQAPQQQLSFFQQKRAEIKDQDRTEGMKFKSTAQQIVRRNCPDLSE